MFRSASLLLLCFIFAAIASAEGKRTFHALVLESMAARGALESGKFEYKVSYYSAANDGKWVWSKKGTYQFDEESGSVANHFSQTFSKKAAKRLLGVSEPGPIVEETEKGLRMRAGGLYTKDVCYVFGLRTPYGYRAVVKSHEASPILNPFNFRSFGYALFGDVARLASYDKVLSSYLVSDETTEIKKDQLPKSMLPVLKDARYFNHGGYIMRMEPERDFWVTKGILMGPLNGKNVVQSECEMRLQRIDGLWLPLRTVYRSHSDRFEYDLDWKAVNGGPKSLDFTLEHIANALEKPVKN